MGWDGHEHALAGKVPRLLDDVVVVSHPVSEDLQGTPGEMSLDDFQGSDIHTGPVLSVSGVEVRRRMIICIEIDDYPVKAAAFRGHPET